VSSVLGECRRNESSLKTRRRWEEAPAPAAVTWHGQIWVWSGLGINMPLLVVIVWSEYMRPRGWRRHGHVIALQYAWASGILHAPRSNLLPISPSLLSSTKPLFCPRHPVVHLDTFLINCLTAQGPLLCAQVQSLFIRFATRSPNLRSDPRGVSSSTMNLWPFSSPPLSKPWRDHRL